MGGNALSFETRRVKRDEYFVLVDEIKEKLKNFGIEKFTDIPAYHTKPDFGDIDILIVSDRPNKDKWIRELFQPKEIYHNSNVFSFDYKDVQVDLIFTKLNDFQSSIDYFSYNDFGNLVGRLAHKRGLRFGHDGLSLSIRDDTQVIGEINLTKNIDEILSLLGYDPAPYHKGFDTLEDIFEYVVSSPYYTYEIFDLDNRNYRARTRDRKRKTYTEFLKWAESRENGTYVYSGNKADYLPLVLHKFNKIDEYASILKAHSINLTIKEKFNGLIVRDLTGLDGKELGSFIAEFRKLFSKEDLLKMSKLMIQSEIENMYSKWESK
ncbi:MAG TPA: hypothetical protein VFM18_10550 [Methanosarcina sp.]|nr:hypothetical protein [Methanosarcina sp.]